MKHAPPTPPTLGERDGLAYALFLPEEPGAEGGRPSPAGGVVILHGAGSAKESHFDFARVCRERGLAALAFDARGHGRSAGAFGPTAFGDVLSMCDLLREHGAPAVALRGSSMGGFCAMHAAALEPSIAAVVAICPAPASLLLRGLRSGRIGRDFEWDAEATEPWLETLDLEAAARALGPATALLLLHARGDEQVPVSVSEELYEAAGEPKRLLAIPGGHHRSLQHDLELQNTSVRFVERAFAARAG